MPRSFGWTCSYVSLCAVVLMPASSSYAQMGFKPTKQHELLAADEGTWDAEVSMWGEPNGTPVKSKGVETNKMLGKLWLLSTFESEMFGEKFTGHSQTGYDPVKKKYVGAWVDTMTPTMMTMEGDFDEKTRTSTMMGTGVEPATGKKVQMKMITRYEDDDNKVFEMHHPVEGQDGKWFKMMEIKYKRRK